MSSIGYCPRGGMDGIQVTKEELQEFARSRGLKYIDEVIPLPAGNAPTCPDSEHEDVDGAVYFESDRGDHGWCCNKCGTVIQWG